MRELCDHVVNCPSPSVLWWVEGAHLPPPPTEERQTLMGTPQPVSSQAGGIDVGATERVGRGSGWCL